MAPKFAQYVRQEKTIAAADSGGIRERWMWGLRLLNDTEKMSSEKSLRHGMTEQLISAVTATGRKLSAAEIRRRLICARTYKTDAEIVRAVDDFETWHDLAAANFPPYDVPEGEPLADWRTDQEREHARRRAMLDLVGEQGSFFPASDFEPIITTLKDLVDYTQQQEELTLRFVEHGRKRRIYLNDLLRVAAYDLSVLWHDAHELLKAEQDPELPEAI